MELPGDNFNPRRGFRLPYPALNTSRSRISFLLQYTDTLLLNAVLFLTENSDFGSSIALALQVSRRNEDVGSNSDTDNQRFSAQEARRRLDQFFPVPGLLLTAFLYQHLHGFSVLLITIWNWGVLLKSNLILKKQASLKGERKHSVLVGSCITLTLHVIGVYWWFKEYNLLDSLIMLPPKNVLPFWNAIFIVHINDILVRQAAMVFKCFVLMYYKNSRGRKYRRQGQMLTMIEYLLLLYRALLPTPIWCSFFLNIGEFSLLYALMYLIFKLTSLIEKVQSLVTAVKALFRKGLHCGALATSEQVAESGGMCSICQEKMHAPVMLQCKHIFCEDCVSEWFERERTCPLCRTIVKPDGLKSYSDGSTTLFFTLG